MWARTVGWVFALGLALGVATVAGKAIGQEDESRAAVVNGTVITTAELDNEVKRYEQQFAGMGRSIDESQLKQLRLKVLDELIEVELIYQKSLKEGIKVDEAEIARQLKILEKQLRRKMVIDEFIETQFRVTEEEAKTYYDNNLEKFAKPEQVWARHILIKVMPDADESQKAEARKKIEEIQAKLQAGEDFATLAKENSEGPSAPKGGDLGYFRRGQMVKPFDDAAFALEPGQTSDIIETRFGYHLIKLEDKEPETTIPYEDAKDNIRQMLEQQKARKELREMVDSLKGEAEIEVFVPKESAGS